MTFNATTATNEMNPSEVTAAFIDRINRHDVSRLAELMTEDHVFVDGMGTTVRGRETMRDGWEAYLRMVPDYWIEIERVIPQGKVVAVFGKAGGTYTADGSLVRENRWEVPAAWQAVVREGKVAHWQVYADNEPIRQLMARVSGA
jgi:ketosteroid isomerase-like protein